MHEEIKFIAAVEVATSFTWAWLKGWWWDITFMSLWIEGSFLLWSANATTTS